MDGIIRFISNFFRMFFAPVGIKCNTSKNQRNNNTHCEKNTKLIHIYSPLSIKIPNIKRTRNNISPLIKASKVILSGVAILPIISPINTAWLKLRNTLAKFSLCRLVKLISCIVTQIKRFVNTLKKLFHLPRFTRLSDYRVNQLYSFFALICVCLFCVLCGFSAFSAFAQEIDVKTKIKELKSKDPAVRILAIQTSRKVEMVQFIHHGEDIQLSSVEAQCRTKEG